MHIPKLGPVKILVDYDLAKIRNVRLEQKGDNDADELRVRFDYDGGVNGLATGCPGRMRNASSRRDHGALLDRKRHHRLLHGDKDGDRRQDRSLRRGAAALFISHSISFYTNFIGEREYEGATVSGLMTAPYNRIIVTHLTLIFGGWIILLIGIPTGALVLLLLLKTAADLHAHRREHTSIDRGG